MTTQETVPTRKRRGPKPTGKGVNVGVRLQPTQLDMLDLWIASQPRPVSRPEAMRMLMMAGLLLVHGDHTRTGQIGPLWTGAEG